MRDIFVSDAMPATGDIITVVPGIVTGYSFTLAVNEKISINVVHMPGGADFAIRVWVSDLPGGNPIVRTPPNACEWSASRMVDAAGVQVIQTVVVREDSLIEDVEETTAVATVPAGVYYLCTENRTNSEVYATISLQTL